MEQEKLELKIQKMIQEENERILKKSETRKHYRDLIQVLILNDDDPEEDLMKMIHNVIT